MSNNQNEIYQQVTDRIVAALQEGHIPWHRPWNIEGGAHRAMSNKKTYRGVNQILLTLTSLSEGYKSPWWVTYKQAEKLGGQVRKGEKSTMVVFFKMIPYEEEDKNGEKQKRAFPFLKYFRVFNIEQCDGIEAPVIPASEFTTLEQAEALVDQMPDRPEINFGFSQAAYSAAEDEVRMPTEDQFDSLEEYYATLYPELVHSTGHESRLNRCPEYTPDGVEAYAKEELIAEIGGSMLCSLVGINHEKTITNTQAYIDNWIRELNENPRLIVQAASKAQGAADFIVGPDEDDERD